MKLILVFDIYDILRPSPTLATIGALALEYTTMQHHRQYAPLFV